MESQANKKGDHSASIAAGSLDKYNAGRHLSPLALACPADARDSSWSMTTDDRDTQ